MMKVNNSIDTAVLQLTTWYLVIIMVVSFAFSAALFQIYKQEFARGLGRQSLIFRDLPLGVVPNLERLRDSQIEESVEHLSRNLVLFNLATLVLGGAAAYLLAKRTLRPIKDAMDAQNRFIADASHELRTPLTSMRTEIEVGMRDEGLDLPEAKRLLASNLEEVVHLNDLASSLLKLAKPAEEKEIGEANISNAAAKTIELVKSAAEAKQIKLENKIAGNVSARFDEPGLIEVLTILVDNAIKYSPASSTITIGTSDVEKRRAVFVKDEGEGIRASDLPHIFDRFYRAELSRTKEQVPGYGLGLAIAKQIAESNHATLSAKSELGKGSEFTITFAPNLPK
jgi:signal transduction histidine kinase